MIVGGDEPSGSVAGGPAHHIPVLLAEVITALKPSHGGVFVDGTFGAGGYTRAILATENTRVIGLDRDPSALRAAESVVADFPDRFTFREARFSDFDAVCRNLGHDAIDGVVFDIGVSSMQLDQPERGFSFRTDGPLDMRMERSGTSAADLVNHADEETLAAILYRYGEERDSRRIARAVVNDRVMSPFTRTKPLADLIGRIVRGAPKGVHPATRTFQALRIAVNDELGQLLSGLEAGERMLREGGVLAAVTFHSLEDRIVKRFLARGAGRTEGGSRHRPDPGPRQDASFTLPGRQPVAPSDDEIAQNPRARAAKLRWAVRTAAPALGADEDIRALTGLGLRTGKA